MRTMLLAILMALAAAPGGEARADPCPPSVRLAGDPALVAAIARELGTRAIHIAVDPRCPSPQVRVARRGTALVIALDNADGSSTERTVSEVRTAASVIESFTRTDLATPLLAARSIPPPPSPPAPRLEQPAISGAPRQRFHLSANLESSLANDGTTWLGASLEGCIEAGPVCAGATLRTSRVASGLGAGAERDLNEVLIGVDLPIALGRFLLTPGIATGMGGMETRIGGMKRETAGFRAEAHVELSVPIANQLALDVSVGAGLGNQTDFDRSLVMVPAEPWGALRASVGLRYGRP